MDIALSFASFDYINSNTKRSQSFCLLALQIEVCIGFSLLTCEIKRIKIVFIHDYNITDISGTIQWKKTKLIAYSSQATVHPYREVKTLTPYEQAVFCWKERKIRNDAELNEALNSHSISFAYHSGKLENPQITFHDTREIFEHDGVTSYTGDLRTLFEIRNAKDAHELLLTSFREKRSLSEELVKEFQYCLTKNTYDTRRWQLGERPGEYKKHDYITGRLEIGAAPEDVQEELSELLSEMTDLPEDKILTVAAYFHVKFENIHPFADGNGRTGRLLMNYLLLLYDHPPIIIHEEDRKAYYQALEAFDEVQELEPMTCFLKEQTVKTWEKQVRRAESKRQETK